MKNILITIVIAAAVISCNSKANDKSYTRKSNNFVVVLDLSDRIIQRSDQIEIDTTAIRSLFHQFEQSVQQNLTVKSSDKFSIRIIPQHKSSLPVGYFENALSIDMSKFSPAEKLNKLNAFRADFSNHLKALYHQALLGNKNSDFAGVDIWQYFNEQINSDLDTLYNNAVLVLTDGYFDFEDQQHGIIDKYHSTTTHPLLNQMKGADWKKKADTLNLGLIPVNLKIPTVWQICCIQSKSGYKDLLEVDKLSYLWTKWLQASGATVINEPIMNSSSEKVQGLITKSF